MKQSVFFLFAVLLFGISAWAQTSAPGVKPTFDIDKHLVPDARLPAPPTVFPTKPQEPSISRGSVASAFSNWFGTASSSSSEAIVPTVLPTSPPLLPTATPLFSPTPIPTPQAVLPTAIPAASHTYSPLAFKEGVKAANRGDFKTARRIWEPLAAKGDKNAQYDLGRMYARGDGVPRDFAKARQFFEAAAAQNQPAALYSLGLMYSNGDGVVANREKSISYYRRAAALGNESAIYALKRLGEY